MHNRLQVTLWFALGFIIPLNPVSYGHIPISHDSYEEEQSYFDAELTEESCYIMFEKFGLLPTESNSIEKISFSDLQAARDAHPELIKQITTTLTKLEQKMQHLLDTQADRTQHAYMEYIIKASFATLRTAALLDIPSTHPQNTTPLITPYELVTITMEHTITAMKQLRASLKQRGITLMQEDLTGQLLGLFYPLYIRSLTSTVFCTWFAYNISHEELTEALARQSRVILRIIPPVVELFAGVFTPSASTTHQPI